MGTERVSIRQYVEIPRPPNYLRLAGTAHQTVDVGSLSDEELTAVSVEWAAALFANAKKRRSTPEPQGGQDG